MDRFTSQTFVPQTAVSRREWLVTLLITLVLASLFSLPYLLGHWLTDSETIFTGLLMNVEDGSYLSAIEQGRQGAWTYRILFTTEAHEPVFMQGFYLAVGQMAGMLGVSAVAGWHLALWGANVVLFLVLYGFMAVFIQDVATRRVAHLLAILGSGFDWWQFPEAFERAGTLEAVPVDLYMPEAHLFFSSLTYPHFSMGVVSIVLVYWLALWVMTATRGGRRGWLLTIGAGLANVMLGIVYPFLIYLTALMISLYYLYLVGQERRILWRVGWQVFTIFAIPLPLFLYYAVVLNSNEIFRTWNDQAVTLSPNPLHFVLAYLPYWVLGGITWRQWPHLNSEQRRRFLALWLWVGTAVVLLYTPVNPQRRFVEGLQVPLAILAAIGLMEMVIPWLLNRPLLQKLWQSPRYTPQSLKRFLATVTILVVGLLNLYIYVGTVMTLAVIQPYPLFRPGGEVEAMHWLRDNSEPTDVVLGSAWTGSYLPSQAGNVVVVGQRFETVFFEVRRGEANAFFAGEADAAAMLQRYDVQFVFVGPAERALGWTETAVSSLLTPVFENDQVTLYKVDFNS